MNQDIQNVLLAGARGLLHEHLAREFPNAVLAGRAPHAAPVHALVFVASPAAPLPDAVEEAAREAEASPSLRHVCLVAPSRAGVDGLLVEDALRYLAGQRGVPFALVRAPASDFESDEPARRLAALAASAARRGLSGTLAAPCPARVVLVTGAAGQIGRAMSRLLDEQGIAHRGVDVAPAPAGSTAPFLRCDLSRPGGEAAIAEFCAPVTHVIHLAGRITNAKSVAERYRAQFELDVAGTQRLLDAMPASLRHFAYASSMTVYGNNVRVPYVDESHPVEPNCIYALCKLAVERRLADWGARAGAKTALLRYTSAYGPGPASGRAIPAMILRLLEGKAPEIYGEGTARRDYIYLDDLCRATVEACLRETEGVLNVGTGVGVSSAELARLLIRLTGAPVEPVFAGRGVDAQGASSLVYDIGRMRRELGFAPEVALEDGLRRTIEHFRRAAGSAAAGAAKDGDGQRQAPVAAQVQGQG